MIIVVDGKSQTVPLTQEKHSFAFVETDPCQEHNISLKLPFVSEGTALTRYNSKLDLSLYSRLLQMFVKTEVCLKKDNSTVNIPEPFEPLRLCIISRGDRKVKRTEAATSFTLEIVNPKTNSGRTLPKNKKITIPIEVLRRCNDSDFHSTSTTDTKENLAATIAIPMITVALIVVALIVAIVVYRNQKERRTEVIKVDENPTYGVYEENENGELRQNSIEVIDTSPDYGYM